MGTGDTVVVLTGADDSTGLAVMDELNRLGTPTVRVDTGDFPLDMSFDTRMCDGAWRGSIRTADSRVSVEKIRSIYYRRPTHFRFPETMSDADAVFAAAEARMGVGGVLAALDVLWVNDPARAAIAEYKPLQLRVAADCGLAVPRTLVTNDHAALVDFAAAIDGPVVCKTLSSLILSEEDEVRITYTTPIEPHQVAALELAATAHLVQELVSKEYEVRVTMVGHRAFPVEIHAHSAASKIDWRADYNSLTYRVTDAPDSVVRGMVRYLGRFGLTFGAFDFIVTPAGGWIMLECNPSGQWLWLQHTTGTPIAAALAALLSDGATT